VAPDGVKAPAVRIEPTIVLPVMEPMAESGVG